ncbi:MAG TPA: ATP-binding cassette domain-containing protein [Gemmatimonadales bacterium]|nr:ATP-binding cassette domain-containing protein [Gemmatimonadales bacterium]
MSQVSPVLAAEAVTKRYAGALALDRVSVSVSPGECVALVGESGAGKSTLLQCFNRLVEVDAGRVTFEGADVRTLDPIALRRGIGYVPQEGGLLPHWSVLRNVGLVPWLRGGPDADAQAETALSLVGLDPPLYAGRRPRELSGGQRQRVALARALAAEPKVVLLDEPFGALDAITRADLRSAFCQLQRRLGFTCVLVTHDLHEAIALAARIVVLRGGRIEQVAAPAALVGAPATEYVATLLARAGVPRT